jgi:hypothetical protein
MSSDVVYEEGKVKQIFRRKMMIIEEEFITENVREEHFEDVYHKVFQYEVPPIPRPITIKTEWLKERFLDDLEERKELARVIGLDELPEITPDAFEKILGLLDKYKLINEKEIDTTEIIKALRKRVTA